MQVSDLLSRWQELRSLGQEVSPEALCADHPELLDELRRQVEALREQGAPVLPSAPPTRAGADTRCSVDGDGPTEPDPAAVAPPRCENRAILGRGGRAG